MKQGSGLRSTFFLLLLLFLFRKSESDLVLHLSSIGHVSRLTSCASFVILLVVL